MFAKRPKRGEEDDDLMRFQADYLKSQEGKPSAKVQRAARPKSGDGQPSHQTASKQADSITKEAAGGEEVRDQSVNSE